jgi:hypothetical protein
MHKTQSVHTNALLVFFTAAGAGVFFDKQTQWMRYSDAKPEIIQKIHKLCENMDEDREVTEKKSSVWMVSKLLLEVCASTGGDGDSLSVRATIPLDSCS